MSPKVLTPQETQALLRANPAAVYIDVRPVAEFATGHPRARGVNIPIVFHHPTTKEIFPNHSFLLVVEDLYSKDTPLVVGCGTEERAMQAAQQLLAAGYTDVTVMQEGFPGWRKAGLPTTADNRAGISYVSLLMKVKRKGKKKTAHASHASS
jgi:rhodanese-related sulfurtransferase